MDKQRSSSSRGKTPAKRKSKRFALDPTFASLIFAGVGIGTYALSAAPRLILLWSTLLALWLSFREARTLRVRYAFSDIGRGVLIGLVVGLPLMAFGFEALAQAVPILYIGSLPTEDLFLTGSMVFTSMVFLAPLSEELFFRNMLQEELGPVVSSLFYALAGLVLFLPTAGSYPIVLLAVCGVMGILGILYAFVYARYGMAVSLSCHATANLVLFVIPTVLSRLPAFSRTP